jgi:hypothetical protein
MSGLRRFAARRALPLADLPQPPRGLRVLCLGARRLLLLVKEVYPAHIRNGKGRRPSLERRFAPVRQRTNRSCRLPSLSRSTNTARGNFERATHVARRRVRAPTYCLADFEFVWHRPFAFPRQEKSPAVGRGTTRNYKGGRKYDGRPHVQLRSVDRRWSPADGMR